jgi:TRAP-type mannitol/chloroaromatic compound transport system permease large subunit
MVPVLRRASAQTSHVDIGACFGNARYGGATAADDVPSGSLLLYIFRSLVLRVGLIVVVLGSIIAGWVAPTESAAVGAAGAAVLISLYRGFSLTVIKDALIKTVDVTAMVFFVVIGAGIFSFVFRFYGGDDLALDLFEGLAISQWGILAAILAILFILGFFIDWIEITLVSLPILHPVIESLDFSAYVGSAPLADVWIAVLVAVVLQTSFLTPPFGFALFFLKGASPPGIRMMTIYRGIAPLVIIQLLAVGLILLIPALATWLPDSLLEIR